MPKYAELVYNGFWFSPEREALQELVDRTQKFVTGTVRVKLYKVGRRRRREGRAGGKGEQERLCVYGFEGAGIQGQRAPCAGKGGKEGGG